MEQGYATYITYLFRKVAHAAEVKWLASVAFSVLGFLFDPTQHFALFALFVLILIDFCLGVAAARYTGDTIRSAKLVRTAIKFTVYFTLIAAARVTEHAVPLSFLDETVTGFLAATELLSILENTGRLGFAVPSKVVEMLSQYVSSKGGSNGSAAPKPPEPPSKTTV